MLVVEKAKNTKKEQNAQNKINLLSLKFSGNCLVRNASVEHKSRTHKFQMCIPRLAVPWREQPTCSCGSFSTGMSWMTLDGEASSQMIAQRSYEG